jgi:drug/metabolite transporter (DMT)-like permease
MARTNGFTAEGTHRDAFGPTEWTQLTVAGLVWGASFIFISVGVEHFSPGVVTFARIAFGTLTLAFIPSARSVRIERADWPRVIAVGVTWMAFPMTLFPLAQQHIASGLAGMLNGSIPVFAAIIGSIALGRLPGRNQRLGLAVGALGIVLLGIPALGDGGSSAVGVILVIVACVSYGFAITLNVPLAQKYGAVSTFWRAQWVAIVLTAPYGMWGAVAEPAWDGRAALAVFILGVGGTALAFVAMSSLSARVGSTRASALIYVEAVIAVILGVVVLDETVRPLEIIGCGVLLAGAWSVSRHDHDELAPALDEPALA